MKTKINFRHLAQKTLDPRLKMRYLVVHHFLNGMNQTQIAEAIGVARGSVNTWISKYLIRAQEGGKLVAADVQNTPNSLLMHRKLVKKAPTENDR